MGPHIPENEEKGCWGSGVLRCQGEGSSDPGLLLNVEEEEAGAQIPGSWQRKGCEVQVPGLKEEGPQGQMQAAENLVSGGAGSPTDSDPEQEAPRLQPSAGDRNLEAFNWESPPPAPPPPVPALD